MSGDQCVLRPSSSFVALRDAVLSLARVDDFHIEQIGCGFFSKVYHACHHLSKEVYVIKMCTRTTYRSLLIKEGQLLRQMSHPNIVKFYGVCIEDRQLHLLLEYINSGTLENLIASDATLDWPLRVRVARDIASAICYVHSLGVFHRDLTSRNILIRKDSRANISAVVVDFGLATKIPARGFLLKSVGACWWMAPESVANKPYNEQVDVFSFGIVLLELIARISADPDYMPRTGNFGLDYMAFARLCPENCQLDLLITAFACCVHAPNSRPRFVQLYRRLESLASMLTDSPDYTASPAASSSLERPSLSVAGCSASYLSLTRRDLSPALSCASMLCRSGSHMHCHCLLNTPVHVAEYVALCDPAYKPERVSARLPVSSASLSCSTFTTSASFRRLLSLPRWRAYLARIADRHSVTRSSSSSQLALATGTHDCRSVLLLATSSMSLPIWPLDTFDMGGDVASSVSEVMPDEALTSWESGFFSFDEQTPFWWRVLLSRRNSFAQRHRGSITGVSSAYTDESNSAEELIDDNRIFVPHNRLVAGTKFISTTDHTHIPMFRPSSTKNRAFVTAQHDGGGSCSTTSSSSSNVVNVRPIRSAIEFFENRSNSSQTVPRVDPLGVKWACHRPDKTSSQNQSKEVPFSLVANCCQMFDRKSRTICEDSAKMTFKMASNCAYPKAIVSQGLVKRKMTMFERQL